MTLIAEDITIGDCRLMLGDCLSILPDLRDKADICFTDPPYKMEIHGRGFASKRDYYSRLDFGTNITFQLTDDFFDHVLNAITEQSIMIFCNKKMLPDILSQAEKRGLTYDILVICKTSPPPLTNNQWLPDKEFCIHLFRNLPVRGAYHNKRTWYVRRNLRNPCSTHPASKPVDVLMPIIENISDPGMTIVDTFMGSASMGLACLNLGRKFIGIERDPLFFEEAVKRIREHYETGPLFLDFE